MATAPDVRLNELLTSTALDLIGRVGADACAFSRAIGDVLMTVVDVPLEGELPEYGVIYLISDYPLTLEVMATRRERALTLEDDGVDEQEAAVLRELGFGSVLLLPFEFCGELWGLVEIYRVEPRPFTDAEVALARELLASTAALAP